MDSSDAEIQALKEKIKSLLKRANAVEETNLKVCEEREAAESLAKEFESVVAELVEDCLIVPSCTCATCRGVRLLRETKND